jgi:protein-tyrosine-phosphatase
MGARRDCPVVMQEVDRLIPRRSRLGDVERVLLESAGTTLDDTSQVANLTLIKGMRKSLNNQNTKSSTSRRRLTASCDAVLLLESELISNHWMSSTESPCMRLCSVVDSYCLALMNARASALSARPQWQISNPGGAHGDRLPPSSFDCQ